MGYIFTVGSPSRFRFQVQIVQAVQPLRSVQALTFLRRDSGQAFLPRVAGEDEGGGLSDLNGLNVLNLLRVSDYA
jgi:hypothetical protein